jgi:cell division protein FtsW (lipid II flippase)
VLVLGPLTAAARPVLVAGAGLTGRSVLAVLAPLDVRAELTDDDDATLAQRAAEGMATVPAATATARVADYAVVTSPGCRRRRRCWWPPRRRGTGVGGRGAGLAPGPVRPVRPPRRWLVVTGTNGKTTTTSMLHEMLLAGGRASLLCGNIGTPVIDVLALPGDHLAVELSSFQLHWSESLRPEAGVVLNVAEDHLDWHGSLPAYAADKARALTGRWPLPGSTTRLPPACWPPRRRPPGWDSGSVNPAPVNSACATACWSTGRSARTTTGACRSRRFRRSRWPGRSACSTRWPPRPWPGRSGWRPRRSRRRSPGSGWAAPRRGGRRRRRGVLRRRLEGHQSARGRGVGARTRGGVAGRRVAERASVEEMLARVGDRLGGAVLFGRDRRAIAEALSRHAPDVPIVEVVTGRMLGWMGLVLPVTIAGVNRSGRRSWLLPSPRRATWPRLATPSCSPRQGRPSTSSAGTATGAIGSPPPSARSTPRLRRGRVAVTSLLSRLAPVPNRRAAAGGATQPFALSRTRFGAWLGKPMTSFHLIVAVAALLVTLGLIMVLSASGVHSYDEDGSPWAIFGKQVLWTLVGLVAFYIAMRTPVNLMRRLAFPAFAVTIVLLVLVLVPGIGTESNGTRGWFVVAGLSMQPSELTKIAFAIWGAHLLAARRMERASLKEMLVPLVPAALIALMLIVIQPDLGQTVSLGIILLALLWYAGLPLKVFLSSLLSVMVAGAVLAVSRVTAPIGCGPGWTRAPTPRARATRPGRPSSRWPTAASSARAGQGTAKWNYLPNAHNDFIFAIIGEELGSSAPSGCWPCSACSPTPACGSRAARPIRSCGCCPRRPPCG